MYSSRMARIRGRRKKAVGYHEVGLEEKNVVGSRKTKQRKVDEKMKKGTCEDKGGRSRDNVRERGDREMRE